jgi:hypothetical protein
MLLILLCNMFACRLLQLASMVSSWLVKMVNQWRQHQLLPAVLEARCNQYGLQGGKHIKAAVQAAALPEVPQSGPYWVEHARQWRQHQLQPASCSP